MRKLKLIWALIWLKTPIFDKFNAYFTAKAKKGDKNLLLCVEGTCELLTFSDGNVVILQASLKDLATEAHKLSDFHESARHFSNVVEDAMDRHIQLQSSIEAVRGMSDVAAILGRMIQQPRKLKPEDIF